MVDADFLFRLFAAGAAVTVAAVVFVLAVL